MAEHRFRVMASDTHLVLVGAAPGEAQWAEGRLRDLEHRWSRFLPSSDISVMNGSGGGIVPVHRDTITLIETMQHASDMTHGRYDPTMLCEIIAAGYSTSIDDSQRISVTVDVPSIGQSVHDVLIDTAGCRIQLPAGLGLDPGGIGKGLAGDIVVSELLHRGAAGALACIGGDLAFAGEPPRGDDWEIAIGDPFDPTGEVMRIGVSAGGVATSSTRSRRWKRNGRDRHHILDPSTRAQSATDLAAVTVVAAAGWQAEALATATILERAATFEAAISGYQVDGLAVAASGDVVVVGALNQLGESAALR